MMKPKFSFLVFFAFLAAWRFDAVAEPKLAPQTEAQIRAILDSPKLASAHVGLSVLDLGDVKSASDFPARAPMGKSLQIVFERDARKKFMPASNMKLFTAAIALHLLGKEKTFPTRVYKDGTNLYLRGGGDPSLQVSDLASLAQQIVARKNFKVQQVIADARAFTAETENGKYPFGWAMDDAQWYYGAEVSALAIERNQADLIITGGVRAGEPATVRLDSPLASVIEMQAKVATVTSPKNLSEERIRFQWLRYFDVPRAQLNVVGQIAERQKMSLGIAIAEPPLAAAALLAQALKNRGVSVPSHTKIVATSRPVSYDKAVLMAQHNSPTLEILLQRFLKKSDNLYAEMLLRDAAFYHDGEKNGTSSRAHQLLEEWLVAQNIRVDDLRFEDGSGLSRYNLLTPRVTAELLAAINRMPQGDAIWNALPIAGVDGTLKNRMQSTPSAGNVRAKTGTFSIASNLSGYVTTRNKKRLAVSLYVNFAHDTATARWAQDEVFIALANGEVVDEVIN